jgi:hypothetical protein
MVGRNGVALEVLAEELTLFYVHSGWVYTDCLVCSIKPMPKLQNKKSLLFRDRKTSLKRRPFANMEFRTDSITHECMVAICTNPSIK